MRLLIQWTTDPPTDWVEYEITKALDLRRLPQKPAPTGGEIIDSAPGWVAGINLQGVIFDGWDHYAADIIGGAIRFTGWNDDMQDPAFTDFLAMDWMFYPPKLRAALDLMDTDQTLTVYDDRSPSPWEGQTTSSGPVVVRPWAEFVVPADRDTRHGINVEDAYWDQVRAARSVHGWREWAL